MRDFPYFIINLLLAVFCLLIMKKYMDAFFRVKKRNPLRYMLWIFYCFMQFCFKLELWFLIQPQFILTINILMVLALCSTAYLTSWKKKFIFSMLTCTLWVLVEIITSTILMNLGLQDVTTAALTGAVISEMCMFLFAVLTVRYMHKKSSRDIPTHYAIAILLIPAGSIYLVHNIFLIAYRHCEYDVFAIISGFVLLVINYVTFEFYDWMVQDEETKERNRLYEQQLELCSQQAEERESFNHEIRRMRHDIKNHLAILLGMVRNRATGEADSYIGNLLNDIGHNMKDVSHSGNIVVDSIVNHKSFLARMDGIAFRANVFVPVRLPFRSGDLGIVFGNLLQNALDACQAIENGERFIELETSYGKEVLIVTICNSYNGNRLRDTNGRLHTTKEDAACHGLGLSSVEQALEPYHGELQTYESGNIFRAVAVLYGYSGENIIS